MTTSSVPIAPVEPGDLLEGRYRVLDELLATDAAGQVVAAFDELLQRRVAVKILERVAGGVNGRRALRAARAASAAIHPRVVRVLDAADPAHDRRSALLVLEYVECRTLAEVMAEGVPSPAEVDRLRDDLLDGVVALHEVGAVHRDLRAENVLVTPGGSALVTAGGLVEAARDEALGLRLGPEPQRDTPAPSPEQARGEPCDLRTDVYALGVLLPALLPDPTPGVAALLRRAVAPDPADRPADAAALRDELRGLLAARVVAPRPRVPAAAPAPPGVGEETAPLAAPVPSFGGGAVPAGTAVPRHRRLLVSVAVLVEMGLLVPLALRSADRSTPADSPATEVVATAPPEPAPQPTPPAPRLAGAAAPPAATLGAVVGAGRPGVEAGADTGAGGSGRAHRP